MVPTTLAVNKLILVHRLVLNDVELPHAVRQWCELLRQPRIARIFSHNFLALFMELAQQGRFMNAPLMVNLLRLSFECFLRSYD